jgi:hypothetical protein
METPKACIIDGKRPQHHAGSAQYTGQGGAPAR